MLMASKSALAAALKLTNDVVERRNTIPILSNVLIDRDDKDRALIKMTDLDVEAVISFDATLDPTFAAYTVHGALLREIVGKLPDQSDIKLDRKSEQSATVSVGRSRFSLHTLPSSDFPDLTAGNLPWHFPVAAKAFAAALAGVSFAISTEETRYYLNGVYMHPTENGVLLVATDGHRLAKRFVPVEDVQQFTGVIIPHKTVRILLKALPAEGDATIAVSTEKLRVSWPGMKLTSKLIDGTFPDYARVIPQGDMMTAEVEAQNLKLAVDRVAVVSGNKGRAMKFSFADGFLTLSAKNPDSGDAEESLSFDGAATLETGFNARYVLDAINHMPDGTITIAAQDAGSPAVLRADGDHVENLIVLMPMRV